MLNTLTPDQTPPTTTNHDTPIEPLQNLASDPRKQRILLLSGLKIFPNLSGGHLRSGGVAKSLARMGYDVRIYSLAGRRSDYGQGMSNLIQPIEENLIEEVDLSLPLGLLQSLSRRSGFPRLWQYFILNFGLVPIALKRRIEWADVILCDLPYSPPVPGPWAQKTWFLLSHNLEHRLLAQGSNRERFFARWMETIENNAALRYDGILACAKEDSEYFKLCSRHPESIRLVANGIDPDLYIQSADEGSALRTTWGLTRDDWLIVFSGSRFAPNLEALKTLKEFCVKERDFLVERRIKFLVLGSIAESSSYSETMLITGPVAETYPYFAAADAALNPVRTGSGSNVKIFEYLAARLPVISTQFGVRGTVLRADKDFIVFEVGKLRESLEKLVGTRSKYSWKVQAEDVWGRVRDSCDMTSILKKEWKSLPLEKALPASQSSEFSVGSAIGMAFVPADVP